MEHPATKLRVWLDEPGKQRSVEKLAARVRKHVDRASEKYIEQIVDGYYPPGRKLALALAEETGVPLVDILSFPYRAPRAA